MNNKTKFIDTDLVKILVILFYNLIVTNTTDNQFGPLKCQINTYHFFERKNIFFYRMPGVPPESKFKCGIHFSICYWEKAEKLLENCDTDLQTTL